MTAMATSPRAVQGRASSSRRSIARAPPTSTRTSRRSSATARPLRMSPRSRSSAPSGGGPSSTSTAGARAPGSSRSRATRRSTSCAAGGAPVRYATRSPTRRTGRRTSTRNSPNGGCSCAMASPRSSRRSASSSSSSFSGGSQTPSSPVSSAAASRAPERGSTARSHDYGRPVVSRDELNARQLAELAALDGILARLSPDMGGEPLDEEHLELAALVDSVRAGAPRMEPEFERRLEAQIARGRGHAAFPRARGRRLALAGGTVLAGALALTIVISAGVLGGGSSGKPPAAVAPRIARPAGTPPRSRSRPAARRPRPRGFSPAPRAPPPPRGPAPRAASSSAPRR